MKLVYELRTYRCVPGRLRDVVARLENHCLPLWRTHGITAVGFWTVMIGESNHDVIYMLRWDSLSQREELWSAFSADPAWRKAKAESEENGQIVSSVSNQILNPTAFSELR
jgi:hypothetical protein